MVYSNPQPPKESKRSKSSSKIFKIWNSLKNTMKSWHLSHPSHPSHPLRAPGKSPRSSEPSGIKSAAASMCCTCYNAPGLGQDA
jgi:hypothetical protein